MQIYLLHWLRGPHVDELFVSTPPLALPFSSEEEVITKSTDTADKAREKGSGKRRRDNGDDTAGKD